MQRRVKPQVCSPESPVQDARAPVGRDGYSLSRALRGCAHPESTSCHGLKGSWDSSKVEEVEGTSREESMGDHRDGNPS